MSIPLIIGVIGGLFGLMGLVTVAVIIVRSNIATTTATLWQGEAAALKNKNERLEDDNTKLTTQIEELKNQYKILEGLKSGTIEIANLTKEVISTSHKNSKGLENIDDKLDTMIRLLRVLPTREGKISNG